ncbi:Hypothetical predicted protein [Mytilus galloprovincialis]|uniref:Uncharacterized protein n=1 Tax=Mytilus galloprovincialis TaxID=29158 RepID=A0A8B6FTN2_MYTGA|nr:Hypothetical predicted protein [Mytilus galloprovincialis]
MPQPAIRPAMGHLIASRPLQILAIDFTVLEPAHGKENNSTTGYSPYYLLFGRSPKLPIDFLLGTNQTDETDQSLDEWIIAHQNRLRYAYEKAGEQTKDRAEYRKNKHDEQRFNPEICVSDKVYIRNRGVHGRNKIQDTWSSTVYRVVRLSENTVTVEPNDGAGVSRTLNRRDVIKCNIQQSVDDNSSESDSSDDMFIPRRTTRATAGKHTNPNRLPNSIFSK